MHSTYCKHNTPYVIIKAQLESGCITTQEFDFIFNYYYALVLRTI